MHPELLNNSTFLRYYSQWQENPASILFAPIAEFFLKVHLIDEAIRICEEGLKHHPSLIMGRVAMAKGYLAKQEKQKAREQLVAVFQQVPQHPIGLELLRQIETADAALPKPWETVTMAKIYAAQGDKDRAKEIYQAILARNPNHVEAREGLSLLCITS